ncbi:MAG: hypothetical protein ABI697_12975, partial [Devosia sp.]
MAKAQLDMFAEGEAELFPGAPVSVGPDPDRIRRRLARIMGEARAASVMPWDDNQRRLYEQVVPQMSLVLPEPEGAQVR